MSGAQKISKFGSARICCMHACVEAVTNEMKEWMLSVKEVVKWHKEMNVEGRLEKESKQFHPFPPSGWKEERNKEIPEKESRKRIK